MLRPPARASAASRCCWVSQRSSSAAAPGQQKLEPELLACAEHHLDEMARCSPHGHLGGLRADVLLLHGAGGAVVPPAEEAWLAQDLLPGRLKEALAMPLLEPVTLERGAERPAMLRLVNFLAGVLVDAGRGGVGEERSSARPGRLRHGSGAAGRSTAS